jgi:hypothetical protein
MLKITLATIGLAMLLALPSAALADGPALSATTTRQGPVTIIDLSGTGFGPGSQVRLLVSRNGDALNTRALLADASGGFSTTLEYGPGLGGRYTFTATSPAGTASSEVVVVETAGAGVGGTRPTMPATDAYTPASGPAESNSTMAVALLVAAFFASFGLGLATLALRARRS